MGEATRKLRTLKERVFARDPYCIYCGGMHPSETIEHMPPRRMFRAKDRPKGLEFGACTKCNQSTSKADLAASFLACALSASPEDDGDFLPMLSAVRNNVSGLLEELAGPPKSLPLLASHPQFKDWHFGRADGPVLNGHMICFAVKMGLALHREETGLVVPPAGGVAVRWFSNYEYYTSQVPVFPFPPARKTLRQGKKAVNSQFEYQWACSDDGTIGAYLSGFRMSFSVLAFVALDAALLDKSPIVHRPGSVW